MWVNVPMTDDCKVKTKIISRLANRKEPPLIVLKGFALSSGTRKEFLLLFHCLYCPCRTLTSFRIKFQASLSLAIFLQPLTSLSFRSFSTSSNHLFLGFLKDQWRVQNMKNVVTLKNKYIIGIYIQNLSSYMTTKIQFTGWNWGNAVDLYFGWASFKPQARHLLLLRFNRLKSLFLTSQSDSFGFYCRTLYMK